MRIFRLMTLLALLATPLAAQDSAEADKTYLEGWIEEALSGAGRDVTITGFRGALSSNATLERMTIADAQGIWFTLEEASLVWSRSALLQGRLEVSELTAKSIELTRLPEDEGGVTPEDTVARPFALPELPVSVSIDTLSAGTVQLGPDVLGEAATLSIESSIELAEGAGDVQLDIRRTDRNDAVTLDAAFSNATRVLRIDLDFDEAQGGLISRMLHIPGRPALRLQVAGEAPLSDFTAQVALSSDGVRRFGGVARIGAVEPDGGSEVGAYDFSTALSGDLRPLFPPDLHPFFGESAVLDVEGRTAKDGSLRLETLRLSTGAMQVAGDLTLAADGWPQEFDLEGRIIADGRLRLPVAAPVTSIGAAEFTASYDAARGEEWRADLLVSGLERAGLAVASAGLEGTGTITRGAGQALTADLGFAATGLTHDDPAVGQAVGRAPQGRLQFAWQPGKPVTVDLLSVTSGDAAMVASGEIDGLAEGFPVTGQASVRAGDLSRFAGLVGRDLAGAASATLQGNGALLGGAFDVDLAATTDDLQTGEARLDPLLRGRSTLNLSARRTEAGTFLDSLALRGETLAADASGRIDATRGALALSATLDELALAEPRLSGPASIDTELGWQADGQVTVSRLRLEAIDAVLTAEGNLATADPDLPAQGHLHLASQDLSRLSALAGRPLAGAVTLDVDGSGRIRGQSLDADISLQATNFRSGMAQLDKLIAGDLTFDARLDLGRGPPFIERMALQTERLTASASSPEPGAPVTLSARLADLGVLAPGITGPAQIEGTVTPRDDRGAEMQVQLGFRGPGGTSADISGQLSDFGRTMALAITGNAPLALANSFIAPQSVQGPARFDLSLNGPPALSSLSGQLSISGARVALPALKTALDNINGQITLGGGQARADLTGNAGTGGSFRLSGPVSLTAPFDAGLEVTLTRLGVRDPELYDTTLDGRVTITGPLRGGARIGGTVLLGRTELRVPSGNGGSVADIPEIRHVNEPAAVRRTRVRAGLLETGGPSAPVAFPLDLVINAPNRIFVRGRGLDAELGGALRLGGTTADVAASGVFNLIRGRMDILTKRLDLTEGLIDLRGSLDPYIRFVARTETDDLIVNIILEGLASAPNVTFTSSPDLPQEEIIARLLFGKGFSEMSAFQAAQLVGAVATLTGRGGGGLTGQVRNALGLSDIDITTTESGATEFSVGTYISDNIYSEISADNEGNNEINLNLDLTSSITVKGRASNDGNTGLGIFFEKDY